MEGTGAFGRAARTGRDVGARIAGALSSGALYTFLFATITALFGSAYTLVISPVIVIFRTRRNAVIPLELLPRIAVSLIALNALAHLAATGAGWCVALNTAVPFLLALVQSSQFEPKAYFGYVMTFVFLELKPLTPAGFAVQLAATAYAALVLTAVLALTRWLKGRAPHPERDLDEGLETLAQVLDRIAEGEGAESLASEATALERAFDRLCYRARGLVRAPDGIATRYYLYATLFQRAVYLLDDASWQRGDERAPDPSSFHDLAALVRQVRAARTPEEHAVVRRCLQMLLDLVEMPEGRVRIFFRSMLHTLMLIVSDEPARGRRLAAAGMVPAREVLRSVLDLIDPDAAQFRFATRLAAVMATTSTVSLLWGFEHVYWLPLNAFLLLMPSYEESAHRMRTRPVGTALGCILVFACGHVVQGTLAVYAFCMVMILFVYACTPGSWQQAVFSSSFALMMASLTIGEATAMALRLLFVLLAVAIVLVVNRFVLPSRRERIYEGNKRQLMRIEDAYWDLVAASVVRHVPQHRSGEMLSAFHLVYEEAYAYAQGLDDAAERSRETGRLVVLWHMFSEVEQVEYLVQSGELPEGDLDLVRTLARRLKGRPAVSSTSHATVALIDEVASDDLRYALHRYVENGRRLAS